MISLWCGVISHNAPQHIRTPAHTQWTHVSLIGHSNCEKILLLQGCSCSKRFPYARHQIWTPTTLLLCLLVFSQTTHREVCKLDLCLLITCFVFAQALVMFRIQRHIYILHYLLAGFVHT